MLIRYYVSNLELKIKVVEEVFGGALLLRAIREAPQR